MIEIAEAGSLSVQVILGRMPSISVEFRVTFVFWTHHSEPSPYNRGAYGVSADSREHPTENAIPREHRLVDLHVRGRSL